LIVRHPRGLPESLASIDRTIIMGVLNVTPDSFSDGGRWLDPALAVAHGTRLHRDGADLVDVGGESTRPGAHRIDAAEELRRVTPVIAGLVEAGVPVSIDTTRAEVADVAVAAGACCVNDVSGGLADPQMIAWLATVSVPYVAMHWRGPSDVMSTLATYGDVVTDVVAELDRRLTALVEAGVDVERVIVDPGLGFAKESPHNWALLHDLSAPSSALLSLGRPVLVGASRKRFLGSLLADDSGQPRSVVMRDYASDAVTALAAGAGVWGVRVHDVRGSRDAVAVASAWRQGDTFTEDEEPRDD
jgi:dihydropteroate synthase